MTFSTSKLLDESRPLGVILVATGLLTGLLENTDLLTITIILLGGITALLAGCIEEAPHK